MSTLFHLSEVTENPDTNFAALQRETCKLISKYCQKFGLDEDIEFTCFELTHKHFKNVQNEVLTQLQSLAGSSIDGKQLNEFLQQAMFTIEMDLPLNLFAIISIAAKYFGSKNWLDMFKMLPKMLLATGKAVSHKELYHTEFNIFRTLDFCVKRSAPYQSIQTILDLSSRAIGEHSRAIEQLLPTCIAMLRFTYTERQRIYKKASTMNSPIRNYIVNATFIASAIVFASATHDNFNDLYAEELLELIKVRTGFADPILRNFSRAIVSEFKQG